MKIDIKPGVYVVAVSGGVDSMVLLDLLTKQPKLKLVVTHFDHGMRSGSAKDRILVQKTAQDNNQPFIYDEGKLGSATSEATAREARYKFLNKVKKASGAKAIITAHHQDDLIETAIINLMRGTHRRGLTSLRSSQVIRPLLAFSKKDILAYAKKHGIKWYEDETNLDTKYLRNYVRHEIMPALTQTKRADLLSHLNKLGKLNIEIDNLLKKNVGRTKTLDRQWFIDLEHNLAKEMMAAWLRSLGVKALDKKRLEILVRAGKTLSAGKKIEVNKDYILGVTKAELALLPRER